MGSALAYYDRISDETKRTWHNKMVEELTSNLEEAERYAKEAHQNYKVSAKAFKEYKPFTTKAKTRIQEIERLMEPLKLEYEKERYAEQYDRHTKNARYYKRMLKLENLFNI